MSYKIEILDEECRNKMFGLVGLPRAGTTIVNNFFNSFDNCFCISEPHWAWIHGNKNKVKTDKIKIKKTSVDDLMSSFENELKNSNKFDLGGVKETFTDKERHVEAREKLLTHDLSFLAIILRTPSYNYDSWSKFNWKGISQEDEFYSAYENLLKLYNDYDGDKYIIFYEHFANNPQKVFNNIFADKMQIDVDEVKIRKGNFSYGARKANESVKIRKPRMNLSSIDRETAQRVDDICKEIYKRHMVENNDGNS